MRTSLRIFSGLLAITIITILSLTEPATQDRSPLRQAAPVTASVQDVNAKVAQLQLPFIENVGQKNDIVKFYSLLQGGNVFVEHNGYIDYEFIQEEDTTWTYREKFLTNHEIVPRGAEPADTVISFLMGPEADWKRSVANYSQIDLGEVYDGINVSLRAFAKNIEKIFTVSPGARVADIRLGFDGVKSLSVTSDGELKLALNDAEISYTEPEAFQIIDGERVDVAVAYAVFAENSYGFVVGDYNPEHDLIIDPFIGSTYLGVNTSPYGSGQAYDSGSKVTIGPGPDYDIFIGGFTQSSGFPTPNSFGTSYDTALHDSGSSTYTRDLFIARFNNTLTTLEAATYLGDFGRDTIYDLEYYDGSMGGVWTGINEGIYLSGFFSTSCCGGNFWPTTNVYGTSYETTSTAPATFVTQIDPTLQSIYASSFGPTGYLTLNANGLYAGSSTELTLWNPALTGLITSTTDYGGSGSETVWAITSDSADNVYICGETYSNDMPVTVGGGFGTSRDTYITKFSGDLSTRLAQRYVGGNGTIEACLSLDTDSADNVIMGGLTNSTNFPTTNTFGISFSTSLAGGMDNFVTKLDSDLNMLASTYLGSTADENFNSGYCGFITVDSNDKIFAVGQAGFSNFPTVPWGIDITYNSGNLYVVRFDEGLTAMESMTYVGANAGGLTSLDPQVIPGSDAIVFTASASASGYLTTVGAYDTTYSSGNDAVVTVVSNDLSITPGTISNLAATAGAASATLTWTAPSGGPNAYIVEYGTVASGTFGSTCLDASCTDGTTGATVPGLTNGVAYQFRVYASNPFFTGAASNTATTTPFDPPDSPSNFTATNFTGSTATLSWTDNSSDEDNFNIYYATTTTQPGSPAYTPADNAESQAVTGLSTSSPNYFWLSSEKSSGESIAIRICLRYSSVAGKILPCAGAASDRFGTSVDIDGDYAIVGSSLDADFGSASGSINIFKKNGSTWTEIAKRFANDPATNDTFGEAVAISGDFAIVGASGNDDNGNISGSAYIFYKDQGGTDNWGELKELHSSDAAASDIFGKSVAIFGDYILVSGKQNDDGASNAGSAYIFEKDLGGTNNWGQRKKLLPGDPGIDAFFGTAVAIDGTRAIISADGDDVAAANSGASYIFEKDLGGTDNWGQRKKLTPSDAALNNNCGSSVAIDGDYAVAGCHGHDSPTSSGAVYIYERNFGGADNWGERVIRKASDATTSAAFGAWVAVEGNNIYAGTPNVNAMYVIKKDTGGTDNWGQFVKIGPSDATSGDAFGTSLGISNDYIIIGSPLDDDLGSSSGSAYAYDTTTFVQPNAPSNFTASAINGFNATLHWVDNSTDETQFRIYYTTVDTQPGTASYFPAANSTSQAVSISPNTPFYFWLTAKNVFLESVPVKICLLYSSTAGKILPCEASANDAFGMSLDIDGDYAVVGAPLADNANGTDAGQSFLFKRNGTTWTQIKLLLASDGAADDQFGQQVSVSGDYVIVGAGEDDNANGTDAGAAYIFYKDQDGTDLWGELIKLLPADGEVNDFFGQSVDIDGDIAIVGQSEDDDNGTDAGSAYIFEKDFGGANSWGQRAKLLASDGQASEHFGVVRVEGSVAVVGAPSGLSGANVTGSAYVFYQDQGGTDNWGELIKLTASDGANGNIFGSEIDISGTHIVIGDPGNDTVATDAGAAYIFEKDTPSADSWGEVKKLTATGGVADDNFGQSAGIYGDKVVIGAPWNATGGADQGKAYIFEKDAGGVNNWGQIGTIVPSDLENGDNFAWSVAMSGSDALIGNINDDDRVAGGGSAYVVDTTNTATPNTPSGSIATPISSSSIDLNWTDNSTDEDGFRIYYSTVNSQPMTPDQTLAANSTSTSITGLSQNTTYYFWVASYNIFGTSAPDTATAITPTGPYPGDQKVQDAAGVGFDVFGFAVDIHNEWAIIGAINKNGGNGAVLIYKKNAGTGIWEEQQSLDGSPLQYMGLDVAIDGTYAVVGGLDIAGGYGGYAQVYKRIADNDWQIADTLVASDTAGFDAFSWSLALDGDYIVVGAPQPDLLGASAIGKAYIFKRDTGLDTWSEVQILSAPDAVAFKQFGWHVAIKGENALIGSQDISGDDNSAYVYNANQGGPDNWGLVQQLTPSDVTPTDLFGTSVSISDNYLAVINSPDNVGTQAKAYIFKDNAGTWTETEIITLPDTIDGWSFDNYKHSSIDLLDDSHVVIGLQWGDGDDTDSGVGYIYARDTGLETWSLAQTISGGDTVLNDYFGFEVGITGSFGDYDVVVTAANGDGVNADSGTAYFYNFTGGSSPGGGGSSSGGSSNSGATCTVHPPKLNLPADLEVTTSGGNPSVQLRWAEAQVSHYTDAEKVDILMDYLRDNPTAQLGNSSHSLRSVFSKFFYDEIYSAGNAVLIRDFEQTLDWIVRNYSALAPDLGGMIQCTDHYSGKIYDALNRLLLTSSEKTELQGMLLKFTGQLLDIERSLSPLGYRPKFNTYYNSRMSTSSSDASGVSLQIYRDGKLIHSQNDLSVTSFTDDTVPQNMTNRTKQLKYYIKTSANCGSENGSTGTASIDPMLVAGTEIDVTADISFRVKQGFDQLFEDKLNKLIEAARNNNKIAIGQSVSSVNQQNIEDPGLPSCTVARAKLDAGYPDSTTIMNYVLACFGSESVNDILRAEQRSLVPPILIALRLGDTANHTVVDAHIQAFLEKITAELSFTQSALSLAGGDLARIDLSVGISSLTSEQKQLIVCVGIPNCDQATRDIIEAYFEGSSHAADVTVEIYDSTESIVNAVDVRSDIFGQVQGLALGQFKAGEEYTVKVRLKDQKYVLPKISKVILNNAQLDAGGHYNATINLVYERHFRFGNFDESNDVIDRNDIIKWGSLLSENPEIWQDANLDGLYGVDLLDVITLQENWGQVLESRVEENQITLQKLAELFGFTSSSTSKLQAPAWLGLMTVECI